MMMTMMLNLIEQNKMKNVLINVTLYFSDVNECEMLSGVCGEALCENVEGSFLCLCSNENQEYDPMSGLCQFRSSTGNAQ